MQHFEVENLKIKDSKLKKSLFTSISGVGYNTKHRGHSDWSGTFLFVISFSGFCCECVARDLMIRFYFPLFFLKDCYCLNKMVLNILEFHQNMLLGELITWLLRFLLLSVVLFTLALIVISVIMFYNVADSIDKISSIKYQVVNLIQIPMFTKNDESILRYPYRHSYLPISVVLYSLYHYQ
ncbi:hypothetical protein AGLY_015673 [Aphis glycines]|uniref:Uncharacterized protein n=1 Tax=Aphis glycines TaxID=307491 RepID=A0A6G0T063_APHGL|nr:hypothetical protein AGLY_015673 [Aphis glycines]